MYDNRGNHKPLTYLSGSTISVMKTYAVVIFAVSVFLVLSLSPVLSLLSNSLTFGSSGTIATISPLHTEGRYIKDMYNRTVLLRGVWLAEYADSCVGAWGGDYYRWNEANVKADMQNLRDVWHVNVVNTFIWGNWWVDDLAVTLGGFSTNQHYRFAIKEAARIAQQYGIYFQIRLWEPNSAEGAVDQPYAPYSTRWTQQDFVNFWSSVATELKGYPNIIFTLYDEPAGNQTLWFTMATQAINAIRAAGAENLVVVHWGFCGDNMWMERWINESRPIHNIVFSNHIYRYHGTFAYNPNSPTDIDYIRAFLAAKPGASYTGAGYKYITDTYNIPIWVSAIGSHNGASDDSEYTYFKNTLQVLNEWNLSYSAYQWFRNGLPWYIGYRTPNRVGQALIDAITASP